jgi:succinate dehydrogenase hydrophobic anchor subunit
LLLVVLVPLHFAVTFLVDDIGSTTARSIGERLHDPTWRMLTWLTIALALLHGAIATDRALARRLPGPGGVVLAAAVALVAAGALAATTWVLTTRIV